MLRKLIPSLALILWLASCSATTSNADSKADTAADNSSNKNTEMAQDPNSVKVAVETSVGDFTILLYGDTPKHRDNFVKLVNDGFYNGTLFHRVIKDFMVQAGDPDSKDAKPGQQLGSGDPGYTIEAEFVYPKHFHKRGALAAARTGDQMNPERRSSGSQFYVVTGRKFNQNEIAQLDQQSQMQQKQQHFNQLAKAHMDEIRQMQAANDTAQLRKLQEQLIEQTETWAKDSVIGLTPEQKEAYATVGGAPHLDGQYTVFGEVLSGMDTIEKIEKAETNRADRPNEDIRILSMKVIK